jgi:hypothetical protein
MTIACFKKKSNIPYTEHPSFWGVFFMKRVLASIAIMAASSLAFASQRPSSEPRLPVNTFSAKGKVEGQFVVVSVETFNKSANKLVCNVFGTAAAYRGGDVNDDEVRFEKTIDKTVLTRSVKSIWTFKFLNQFGTDFKVNKPSIRAHGSCTPDMNKDPSTSCDPAYQDCDWTCQASKHDPKQCADDDKPWSDDSGVFL